MTEAAVAAHDRHSAPLIVSASRLGSMGFPKEPIDKGAQGKLFVLISGVEDYVLWGQINLADPLMTADGVNWAILVAFIIIVS